MRSVPTKRCAACLVLLGLVGTACTGGASHTSTQGATSTVATVAVTPSGSATTAPAGGSRSLPPLPPQPADVPFPTVRWPRGPLPAGITKSRIETEINQTLGGPNPTELHSLLVVKGGRLVYETYGRRFGRSSIMTSWSIAKSFTSAVIGLLVGDGRLHLNGPAPVRAWSNPNDPRHAITIADLLHMSSGLEWDEDYANSSASDAFKLIGEPNASEYAANLPLKAKPGTVWNYSTGTGAILSGIIIDTLGSEQAAEHYIRTRLLAPIGIRSTRFLHDKSGRWFGGIGADSTAQDFARLGLLYLRDGVWNHQRILPRGWVDYTRTPGPVSPQYGALWWLNDEPGTFTAVGLAGQYILVAPALDLVIVVTSTSNLASGLLQAVYRTFAAA